MLNDYNRKQIAPWQEHGRWYKMLAKIEKIGSNYAWAIDYDNSDPIFQQWDGFSMGTTTTTYIPIVNETGETRYLLDVHRGIIKTTGALSVTQSASAPVSAVIPASSIVNIYVGLTANATNFNYGTTVEVYLFIK